MTRLRRIEDRDRIFLVTTNLARGVAPLTATERDCLVEIMSRQRLRGDLLLFAYVIMPTHAHALIAPQNKSLIQVMRNWKSVGGYEITQQRKTRGPLWQERYFDSIIRRIRDFWKKVEYIHQNPVEAGLVLEQGDWKWSSYGRIAGSKAETPEIDRTDFPADGSHPLWPAPWRKP
jgi:putative transposase